MRGQREIMTSGRPRALAGAGRVPAVFPQAREQRPRSRPTRGGTQGRSTRLPSIVRHPLVDAFIGAGQAPALRKVNFNDGDQEGVGYYQLTTRNGWRCSTAVAYLRLARSRGRRCSRDRAHTTAILFERAGAVGVRYAVDGQLHRAQGEVVLCAARCSRCNCCSCRASSRACCRRKWAFLSCTRCSALARTCRTTRRSA
ncbi:GMC family oxidoreductase N-terminal domain-containing protein [Cupriavidus basilensis]